MRTHDDGGEVTRPDITTVAQLCAQVKTLRDEQGLTQDNVAGRAAKRGLRIRRERISEIENGRREPPSCNELRAILIGLGKPDDVVAELQATLVRVTRTPANGHDLKIPAVNGDHQEPEKNSNETPDTPAPAGRRLRQAGLVLGGTVAGVLLATGVAGVWPWTIFTHEPDLQVNVGRPNPADASGVCPQRTTDVRDPRDDTAGSIWYRECTDYLEVWVTDHMKDGRCIWAAVHWSNGITDTSARACPAGRMEFSKITKQTSDYWIELVAKETK